MLKDRKSVWVVEYLIGIALLVAVLPSIIHPHPGWSEAHGWAYLLFIACSGITLLGLASAMRQRIALADRITKLEQMAEDLKFAQKQVRNEGGQKRTASEPRQVGVGSVN
jgi:hypothetical protein